MLFLGIVMMPFYYGSKARSVPEFMRRRFGKPAHLVNGISFAAAQILIAGANLFLLASVVNLLLGWPLWVSIIIAALIVLPTPHSAAFPRPSTTRCCSSSSSSPRCCR
jgi:SSS family solute:Na+ symporter